MDAITVPLAAAGVLAAAKLLDKLKKRPRRQRRRDPLDDVLFNFPTGDPYRLRHLLRSVEVKGITGSGKSSGSGNFFAEAIVRHPRSTCLIIAQKPEDKEFYQHKFARYNKPLVVMEQGGPIRCNFLDAERAAGSDARGLVEFLLTLGEALNGGKSGGGVNEQFWRDMQERFLYNAVEMVRQGNGKLDAPSLLQFFSTAAYKPESLLDAGWKQGFHNQTMRAAFERKKTPVEDADFRLAFSFWTNEFPRMDDRPRSSALAGVMNILHTFNTGMVRDYCSTETTISPAVMEQGISVLVNFPFTGDGRNPGGPTSRFIAGGMKYLWQKHILRRQWDPAGYFNVMIMDEYQESATELDARYLAQCRSHGGCLFCLTQTIHSEYSAIGGAGHHRADQLLSNFGLHVYHTVDPQTAQFASALLGQRREDFVVLTPQTPASLGDEIFGMAPMGISVNQQYCPTLQPAAFMAGLRCGGPPDYCVDGIVIRGGERFANGQNWLFMSFPQR